MEPSPNPKDLSGSEAAIRALEAAYDEAWNARNIDGLLACMTRDAVIVDPGGVVSRGLDEIRQMLSPLVVTAQAASEHKTEILGVEFVTSDVAVVDGCAQVHKIVVGQELVAGDYIHRFTDVVVRSDGRWKIAHVHACPLRVR